DTGTEQVETQKQSRQAAQRLPPGKDYHRTERIGTPCGGTVTPNAMTPEADSGSEWSDWIVATDSGFRVDNDKGQVVVAQITEGLFSVKTEFVFDHQPTLDRYRRELEKKVPADQAAKMVDAARTFADVPSTTDFASIPPFLGWFERPYGRHTLAAVLHDQLIVDEPNGGALGSDTLADSFFRDLIGASGVPTLKRWLMWAAVAARTRWAAGGRRRLLLVLWVILGVIGVGFAAQALMAAFFGSITWSTAFGRIFFSFLLGLVSSVLWGRQWGAGLVAALTGIWLIPATVFVVIGLAVYWAMEKAAG
ncbi:MAG: DUF1353 domain-containing protein, partial [Acidimicrobiia bacterium]|nr:DUF1353 domain-containing protein [Acidimicrobiia bacterium]